MNKKLKAKEKGDVLVLVAKKATTSDWDFKYGNPAVFSFNSDKLSGSDLTSLLTKKLNDKTRKYQLDLDSFVNELSSKTLSKTAVVNAVLSVVELMNNPRPFNVKKDAKNKKANDNLSYTFSASLKSLVAETKVLVEAQTFARYLQDQPSNYLNPKTFVKQVKDKFATLKNVEVKVLTHKQLLAKKMGLITGVAQGSDTGAYLVTLELKTDPKKDRLALVGKGVCFDTGGYSLKTGGHLRGMKFDMSGAAAVAASVYALAKNNVKTNVVGVLGIVENLISLKSYRVDDVLTSYVGLTVEVDNTDAEGRLVLADCLTYAAKDLKAKKMVSIATLTGAIISALGETYAGGWATSDADWSVLDTAAKNAAEGLWRMPFHFDYLNLLKSSHVADLKNSCASPFGGSSRAACFLKEFTNNVNYMHLDIAGMDSFVGGVGRGPFVKVLYEFAKTYK